MAVIDFELNCSDCGRSLQGVDIEGTCPGCDSGVGDTLNINVIDRKTLRICADVMCVNCGYNLRTLEIASVCPECATTVADSLHSAELRFANRDWLRKVRRGIWLLLVTVVISAASALFWRFFIPLFSSPPFETIQQYTMLIHLVNSTIVFWAVYLATLPNPGLAPTPSKLPRRIACIAAGISLTYSGIYILLDLAGVNISNLFMSVQFMFVWISSWYFVTCLVKVCVDICLRRLAWQAERRGLRRFTAVHVFLSVCMFVVLSSNWIGIVYAGYIPILDRLEDIVQLLFYPLSLIMFLMYARMLTAAIRGRR